MPNIDKIKRFKKDILDDLLNERIKKESLGVKVDVDPPVEGEKVIPWEEENEILNEDFQENRDIDFIEKKSINIDSILGSLGLKEKGSEVSGSEEKDVDSNESFLIQDDDEKVLNSVKISNIEVDSEFKNLDEEFNLERDEEFESNIEKILDENSISLNEASKLNFEDKISHDEQNNFKSQKIDDAYGRTESAFKDISTPSGLDYNALKDNSDDLESGFSLDLDDFKEKTTNNDNNFSHYNNFSNFDDLIDNFSDSGELNKKSDDLVKNNFSVDDILEKDLFNENKDSIDETYDFSNFYNDFNFLEDGFKKNTKNSEIKINYPSFLKNLKSYPRNLRIAIAEALTQHRVPKYKLHALIDLVEKNKKGLKYIAKFAGDIVGRSIKLPLVYFKAEEFKKLEEQLGYRIKKAIIPIIKVASVFIVLTTATFYFLVNTVFLYIVSERKYKEGISYIYENKRDLAKSTFKDAYFIRPNNRWFIAYAKAFEDVRDFDSAEEKYEELFTINPFAKNSKERRLKNFDRDGYISFAKMKMKLGEYDEANRMLDKVVLNGVYDYDGLIAKGDNYLKWAKIDSRYYKESIKSYKMLLSKYGYTKEILFKLFNSYIESGSELESDNMNTFIKLNETIDIDEKVYTKYVAQLINRYIDFVIYNRRVNILSKDLNSKYFSGQVNLLNKDFSNFKTDNDKTITNTLNSLNINSEIESIIRRILFKNPNYDKALFEIGRYFYHIGDIKKAKGYLFAALNIFRNTESISNVKDKILTYKILADIYEKDNDKFKLSNIISLALSDYDFYKKHSLINISKEVSLIYDRQGDILASLNKHKLAIDAYKMAITEGANYPDIYYKIASLNYREKKYKDALDYLFKVENMAGYSNRNELLYLIGLVLYKMGDFVSSRSYYMRILDNLERKKISAANFSPRENEHHKLLLINKIETLNNLGVIEVRLSDGSLKNEELFNIGVSNLTESSRLFDILSRDDNMVKSVRKDFSSLNLRSIWNNNFKGKNIFFYEKLPEKL